MVEDDRAAAGPCVIYLLGSHFGYIRARPVRTGGSYWHSSRFGKERTRKVFSRGFRPLCSASGVLRELRTRRFFRSKGEQTRLDKARSLRRLRRRQRTNRT